MKIDLNKIKQIIKEELAISNPFTKEVIKMYHMAGDTESKERFLQAVKEFMHGEPITIPGTYPIILRLAAKKADNILPTYDEVEAAVLSSEKPKTPRMLGGTLRQHAPEYDPDPTIRRRWD